MPHRRTPPRLATGFAFATVLTLVAVASAFAKGEGVTATLDPLGTAPHAGTTTTIGVRLAFYEGSPVQGATVTLTLTEIGTARQVVVPASEVTIGHYAAQVNVPDKGGWTVVVSVTMGETRSFQLGVIRFQAPLAVPPSASSTAIGPTQLWPLTVGLLAILVAAGLAVRLLATRRRTLASQPRG